MKTGWKVATAVVWIGGSVWAGSLLNMQAEGAGTTPGTADDPVVTKSYVDQAIQQAIGGGEVRARQAPKRAFNWRFWRRFKRRGDQNRRGEAGEDSRCRCGGGVYRPLREGCDL